MSRYSVNGIPSNWLAVLVALLGVFISHDAWDDARFNTVNPRPITVAAFANTAASTSKHLYVSVSGVVIPKARVSVEGNSSSYDLVALLDKHSPQGIWVQVKPGEYAGAKPFPVKISGMMRGMSSDVRSHVASTDAQVGGVPMETTTWLCAGQTPPAPLVPALWLAFTGGTALCFVGLSLARNVVFWPQKAPGVAPAPIPADQAIPLRLSGKLRLHAKATGRFLNVPARTVHLEDGTFAFASLLDASKRLEGRMTEQRAGVWLLVPTGAWKIRTGLLAHGLRRYPAVKVSYHDALDKNRRASAVLACEDEPTRAALLARLHAEAPRAASGPSSNPSGSSSASPFQPI